MSKSTLTDNIHQTIHGEANARYTLLKALADKAERQTTDVFNAGQTSNMAAVMSVGNTTQPSLN